MGTIIVQGVCAKEFIRELVMADMRLGKTILLHRNAGFTEFKPIAKVINSVKREMLLEQNTTIVINSDNLHIDSLIEHLPPVGGEFATIVINMVPCINAQDFKKLQAKHYKADKASLSFTTSYVYMKEQAILEEIMSILKVEDTTVRESEEISE